MPALEQQPDHLFASAAGRTVNCRDIVDPVRIETQVERQPDCWRSVRYQQL